jgi:hypothetical protein
VVRMGVDESGKRILLSDEFNHISLWCEDFQIDFGNAALKCDSAAGANTTSVRPTATANDTASAGAAKPAEAEEKAGASAPAESSAAPEVEKEAVSTGSTQPVATSGSAGAQETAAPAATPSAGSVSGVNGHEAFSCRVLACGVGAAVLVGLIL